MGRCAKLQMRAKQTAAAVDGVAVGKARSDNNAVPQTQNCQSYVSSESVNKPTAANTPYPAPVATVAISPTPTAPPAQKAVEKAATVTATPARKLDVWSDDLWS